MTLDVQEFKQGQRAVWSAGDYPQIAELIQVAADDTVERLDIGEGDNVLDVATGSGNLAITAAKRGARVTGLDITPELVEFARKRAEAEGLEIEFVEGDAEELPFENGSFDVATSIFGVMFAPRHEQAAAELVRVVAAGGRIGVAAWTPEGVNGRMFKTVGEHMPPPPPELKPAAMWGAEDYVRELFADQPVELELERRSVTFEFDSPEDQLAWMEVRLGPVIMAKRVLEPEGKWDALRSDLLALANDVNQSSDGGYKAVAEYLLTIARVAS